MKCFNCGKKTPKNSMVKLSNIALGYVYYCEKCVKPAILLGEAVKYPAYRPGKQNTIKKEHSKRTKGSVYIKK